MITISPKVAQLSMGGKHPNSISSSSLSRLKKQSLFTTPIFYTIQSANNKVGLSFYLRYATISPEVKFSYGLKDLHKLSSTYPLMNNLEKVTSNFVYFTLHIER